MDDILAKHLAKILLFKENKNSVFIKTDKKQKSINEDQYNYKLIDGKYYINTADDVMVLEKIGIWKNKDIVKVNEEKYVIMESSKTMIPLRHISNEEFNKNFTRLDKIPEDKKVVKSKFSYQTPITSPVGKTEDISKKETINIPKNIIKNVFRKKEDTIKKEIEENPQNIETPEDESTEKYINDIKKSTNSEFSKNFEEDAEENEESNSFFDMLEKKKDDPRVKKFFNYHADAMKKEFNQIIEKVKTSQFARAMESGGGTNAVQYANGGIMTGTLNVTDQIISENVTDTTGRELVNKKKFDIIGNGSNNTFTFTHNFNTKDILINIYDSVNYQLVFVSSVNIDLNNTTITFPNDLKVGENYRVILFA